MPRKRDANGRDLINFSAICRVTDNRGNESIIAIKLDKPFIRVMEALIYIEREWRPKLPDGLKLVCPLAVSETRYQNQVLAEKRRTCRLVPATA